MPLLENAEAGYSIPLQFPRLASFELRTHYSLKLEILTPPDELLSFCFWLPNINISFLALWPPSLFICNMQFLNIAGYCVSTQFSCNWLLAVSGTTREVLEWKNASKGTLAGPLPYASRFGVSGMPTVWRNLQWNASAFAVKERVMVIFTEGSKASVTAYFGKPWHLL